jgi:hypothetical protein
LGDAALRLVDRLGPDVIDLIPWQEGSVLDICATDDDDQFAASAFGEVVSRQNGKGGVLEVRVVAGVTLPQFREKRILWTAHTWKTAADAHERVANIFLSHPSLKSRLVGNGEPHKGGIGYGNVSRSINLKDGSQILFFTRSNFGRPWSVGRPADHRRGPGRHRRRAVGAAVHDADGGDPDRPARADDLRVDAAG